MRLEVRTVYITAKSMKVVCFCKNVSECTTSHPKDSTLHNQSRENIAHGAF